MMDSLPDRTSMSIASAIETSWVAPPQVIGGLDHLGTQGPCIAIYTQLLPGITNVTDRARYYSFYPWLIWSYEKRTHEGESFDAFIDAYRRADCLFTLIAERHARVIADDPARHGPAMVGREALNPVLDKLQAGGDVRLSTYATREQVAQRYFANRLGGLGQYYLGTLTQLDVLSVPHRPWINYTLERGVPIAEAFDAAVAGRAFWKAIEDDVINAQTLDDLHAFCPCCLPKQATEQGVLLDTFFDRRAVYAEEGVQRRKTLALILHLASALEATGDSELEEAAFRAAVYTRTLPDGSAWRPPGTLEHTVKAWAHYVKSDILSVVAQTALTISLKALPTEPTIPSSIEEFARLLVERRAVRDALKRHRAQTFGDLCERVRTTLPALSEIHSEHHELQWFVRRLSNNLIEDDAIPGFLASVIWMLAVLHVRDDLESPPFGPLTLDERLLQESPINLASVRARCLAWQVTPLAEVVEEFVAWCLETHLHVALRKLRQNSKATFKIHPTDRGLEPCGEAVPAPVKTNPRFRQAVKILWDLGVLARREDGTGALRITELGRVLYEASHG